MSRTMEGKIWIPLEDFWAFVEKYAPNGCDEVVYGVPCVTPDSPNDIQITFAASSDGHPIDWSIPPACLSEWKKLEGSK